MKSIHLLQCCASTLGRLSQKRVALIAIMTLLIQGAQSLSAQCAVLNAEKSKPSTILQGALSQSALADNLAYVGLWLAADPQSKLIVDEVKTGGPAYLAGITKGDRILSCQAIKDGFNILIERSGKRYSAKVRATHLSDGVSQTQVAAGIQSQGLHIGLNRESSVPLIGTVKSDHPFLASDIAHDGVKGVEQSVYPDCWLEATIAAFANVPKGQELIANSIRSEGDGGFLVTLPNSSAEHVDNAEFQRRQLGNRSQWASAIEASVMHKCSVGAVGGATLRKPAILTGVEMLTGAPGICLRPDQTSIEDMRKLLQRFQTERIPAVLSTKDPGESGCPPVITPNHGFAFIAYARESDTVIIRNAMGSESQFPAAYSAGVEIGQNGMVKMPVTQLQTYIRYIAYPSR